MPRIGYARGLTEDQATEFGKTEERPGERERAALDAP